MKNNNKIVTPLYGDTGYLTSHGDHFVMYKNMELLCWSPETNIVSQLHLSKKIGLAKASLNILL